MRFQKYHESYGRTPIQLIGDSLAQDGGWTGVVGNPAKLGLGLVSICFDVIFT